MAPPPPPACHDALTAQQVAALQSSQASSLAAAAAKVATALARDPAVAPEQQQALLQKHLLAQLQQMQLHAVGQMVMDGLIAKEAAGALGHGAAPQHPPSRAVPTPRAPSVRGSDSVGGSAPDSSWQSAASDIEGAGPGRRSETAFALDPDRVARGEDRRTTLMIRNIPNKYSQKMLLQTIDEANRGRCVQGQGARAGELHSPPTSQRCTPLSPRPHPLAPAATTSCTCPSTSRTAAGWATRSST